MKFKLPLLLTVIILDTVIVGSNTLAALAAPPAYPEGTISVTVQDQTSQSGIVAAPNIPNAKPGDILKYVINVHNNAPGGQGSSMYYTYLTNTLPTGLALITNTSQRTVTKNIGVIKAGQTFSYSYLAKLTNTSPGGRLDNKACFRSDSKTKDSPQRGCDTASINAFSSTPATMPSTGSSFCIPLLVAFCTGIAGYFGRLYVLRRRILHLPTL